MQYVILEDATWFCLWAHSSSIIKHFYFNKSLPHVVACSKIPGLGRPRNESQLGSKVRAMTCTASTSGFISCLLVVVEHLGMHWETRGVCMATSDSDLFSLHVLLLSNVWNNCMSLLVYFSYENTLFPYRWFPGFNIITDNFVRKMACQFWFWVFPPEVSQGLHMLGVKVHSPLIGHSSFLLRWEFTRGQPMHMFM